MTRTRAMCVSLAMTAALPLTGAGQQRPENDPQQFIFRTGIDLIYVTATVTDRRGRFVPGLTVDDFIVYDDGVRVDVTTFSNERVPVSLGIALDTSGSMDGLKMDSARTALDHLLYDLLGLDDQIFLYEFNYTPDLIEDWTTDRNRLSRALRDLRPRGGTALYDAVSESIPRLEDGRHEKKALLIISDGNDTNSEIDVKDLRQDIRESEALVYAIGIDGDSRRTGWSRGPALPLPGRSPFPFPGGGRRQPQPPRGLFGGGGLPQDERVNVTALRDLTDDSGGRTEIIRDPSDLDPATAGIAQELNQQYFLGYPVPDEKDGQWHSIRVEVRNSAYRVRARRGYTATP